MQLTSALAIYFIIWWLVLFITLPIGVKNAHEAGETVTGGNDAGAPVAPHLWWKAKLTTVIATIVFAAVYTTLVSGVLETMDIPFIRDLPRI